MAARHIRQLTRGAVRTLLAALLTAGLWALPSFRSAHAARQDEGARYSDTRLILEAWLGEEEAAEVLAFIGEGERELLRTVYDAANERLRPKVEERLRGMRGVAGAAGPARRRYTPASSLRRLSGGGPATWRTVAAAFQIHPEDPELKLEEVADGVVGSGQTSKTTETDKAVVNAAEAARVKSYLDGKRFGYESENVSVVDVRLKAEPKTLRKEVTFRTRVELPACPDANGVIKGVGISEILTKLTIRLPKDVTAVSINVVATAQITGRVGDDAELIGYDLEADVFDKRFGYDRALSHGFVQRVEAPDGEVGVRMRVTGQSPSMKSRGVPGREEWTPGKSGEVSAQPITPDFTKADEKRMGAAAAATITGLLTDADKYFEDARDNWQGGGCVEVECRAPKAALGPQERVEVVAETVHRQDKSRVKAMLEASASGTVTPASQEGAPSATFLLTAPPKEEMDDGRVTLSVSSVSRRGIGTGRIEFDAGGAEREDSKGDAADASGECELAWAGTVTAERRLRVEKEKRSGNMLAENGGYEEMVFRAQLTLAGRRDGSGGEANAFLMPATASFEEIDFEYHKYSDEEGFCGAAATPYKGPVEKTRTSRTTAEFGGGVSVLLGLGRATATFEFSLPEMKGRAEHSYTRKSSCAFNDRENTGQASDDDVRVPGGNFSVAFPLDPTRLTATGSRTVREEDGSVTVYTWRLKRCAAARKL